MVLGYCTQEDPSPFAYGAITLSGGPFQTSSARRGFCNFPRGAHTPPVQPHYPPLATGAPFYTSEV